MFSSCSKGGGLIIFNRSFPKVAVSVVISYKYDLMPLFAKSAANWAPITPAPITATLLIFILLDGIQALQKFAYYWFS